MKTPRTLTLNSDAEYDAVIAALRLLAWHVLPPEFQSGDVDITSILTNEGLHPGLTSDEVHDIADRFQGITA